MMHGFYQDHITLDIIDKIIFFKILIISKCVVFDDKEYDIFVWYDANVDP